MPRWSLVVLSGVHALLLAWAALVLPWRSWTAFAIFTALVAAAHLATAVLAALRHRLLPRVWRAQALLSLAYLVYLAWGLLSSALYLRSLYEGLGDGVAAALVAALLPAVLVTVPMACWGIAATGGWRPGRRALGGVAALVLALAIGVAEVERAARGERLADDDAIAGLTLDVAGLPELERPSSLFHASPAGCAEAPRAGHTTLVATFASRRGAPETRCVQSSDAAAAASELARTIAEAALRAPVKVDLLTRLAPIPHDSLLESLALRPGLDGVCALADGGARCLMPWQLVALNAFTQHQVLPGVPDARLGVAIDQLRRALGVEATSPLWRVATASRVVTEQGMRSARRSGEPATLDAATLAQAAERAQAYVLAAQQRNGRFKYIVDPYSGRTVDSSFSIARQAGTTLALCELAPNDKPTRAAVRKSLDMLAKLEAGELGILRMPDEKGASERIGPSALSLAALLRCRPRVGDRYDALAGRLARTLLGQQRGDGGFAHGFDVARAGPASGRGTLYADGQIVLALVLMEAADDPAASWPARGELHDAVERAMSWFSERYWPRFAGSFFFLEENWHCLAAHAALASHRHDGYERFCLDYVAFKRRIVNGDDSDVHRDFVGGYGIGNVVPPHNTATAGFGEALAAAIEVMRARGLDTREDEQVLQAVLGFLVRNQWDDSSTWPCRSGAAIIGGFSEHMASPNIRIDYVQHAWAAIGHGAAALRLTR